VLPADNGARVRELAEKLIATHDPRVTPAAEFLGARFDAGLAWVHFPEGSGGLGLPRAAQAAADAVIDAAGGPSAFYGNPIGIGMAAPTVATFGSDEQKSRYLRRMYTCEDIWCQLFSEPGAGSDVAGLSTRAVRDGSEWVVDGQKVWTSLAHVSSYGLLLARTDPDVPKHKGMSYFVLDMHAPGVEVRPLRQMTGDAEFNEVYLTGVRIPDSERLGSVGQGWTVALTTLMNERTALGGAVGPRGAGPIGEAVALWHSRPDRHSAVARDRLVRLWAEAEAHRLTTKRAAAGADRGMPGPEGSVGKLISSGLNKRIYDFCVDFLGPEGALYGSYEPRQLGESRGGGRGEGSESRGGGIAGNRSADGEIQRRFLRSLANSIEGGTSEIMRNILGERVLGLPGDPRVDKDVPWRDVPRS
jgi:alkylation response protein AidB-like acyl-CoA dehydrogenase